MERAENTKNTLEHAPTVPPSEETTENTGSKENRLLRRRISPSHWCDTANVISLIYTLINYCTRTQLDKGRTLRNNCQPANFSTNALLITHISIAVSIDNCDNWWRRQLGPDWREGGLVDWQCYNPATHSRAQLAGKSCYVPHSTY